MRKEYRLFEKKDDDCIAVDDTSEIINITHPDAIYDNSDGWCKCLKENKEYDLYEEDQADLFNKSHKLCYQINDFEIYKCLV